MRIAKFAAICILDHDRVSKQFEGCPQFIREFCVRGMDQPTAVYKIEHPNREKGQKDFLLLRKNPATDLLGVSGMNLDEMEKERYQSAMQCKQCGEIVYSPGKHIQVWCSCGDVSVEGGKASFRWNGQPRDAFPVVLDLITAMIVGTGYSCTPFVFD